MSNTIPTNHPMLFALGLVCPWPCSDNGELPAALAVASLGLGFRPVMAGTPADLERLKRTHGPKTTIGQILAARKKEGSHA